MGHLLQAFIGRDPILDAMRGAEHFPFVARLPFGLSLVPIDETWIAGEDDRDPRAHEGLPPYTFRGAGGLRMEPVVARVGVRHCERGRLLFMRSESFGGEGDSEAWLFEPGPGIELVGVNRGLAMLGVKRTHVDEWDSVGLASYRSSSWDDWREHQARGALVHTRDRSR